MLIEDADYFVLLVPFPAEAKIHACTLLNDDGSFSVYLDSQTTPERRKRAMRHEYNHMARDDMFGDKSIIDIEKV